MDVEHLKKLVESENHLVWSYYHTLTETVDKVNKQVNDLNERIARLENVRTK